MKKKFILILVIPFLCLTHKTLLSSNYTHTADELHKICFGSINFEQQSYCLGFIIGATDTLKRLKKICIPKAIKGDQIRDWLHVSDHCEAIKTILEKGQVFETYNIGGSNEIKNIDIVKTICDELDALLPHPEGRSYSDFISFVSDRPGHDKRYAIDSTKIQEKLNWKPKISFKKGITDTIKWYLENSEWLHKIKNKNYDGWVNKNYNNR